PGSLPEVQDDRLGTRGGEEPRCLAFRARCTRIGTACRLPSRMRLPNRDAIGCACVDPPPFAGATPLARRRARRRLSAPSEQPTDPSRGMSFMPLQGFDYGQCQIFLIDI